MVKQVGLLVAGCQPWNTDVCAASGDRFAFCATQAIYVYQLDRKYNEFRLLSIMSEHKKTVTSIAWHPKNPDIFASSSAEEKIIVWDVVKQTILAVRDKLRGTPVTIGWNAIYSESIAFIHGRGPMFLWTYNGSSLTMSSVKETSSFSHDVTCFKWHPKKTEKVALGHKDGSISLCTVGSKCIKHTLRPETDDSDENDPVVTLQWDPLSIDYLLVANAGSGVRLVDSVSQSVIMSFHCPSAAAKVCTVSWLTNAPGMFITGDSHSGILRVWNVSKSSPVETIRVKKTGFHTLLAICDNLSNISNKNSGNNDVSSPISSTSVAHAPAMTTLSNFALPPAHVVCTFMDGGVGVYDLGRRKWNFLRDQGHVETIFDCRFHPADADLLATASFDGTIKLWNINTLTCVSSSPGNEGIIYSISWAPSDLNCIVAATSKMGIFIWDVGKCRVIKRFNEHGKTSVYNVSWNQKDSRRILSCGADGFCVVRQVDRELIHKYRHPGAVYGGDWSPHNKDMLATGCDDKNVRVYYAATSTDQPMKVFSGHTAKVFHVKWSPLKEGLLCSGSDDGSVRVWDYSQDACISVLTGHTGPVRGLLWNSEIPYLVISGSWDSNIRIWDIRSGSCRDTILDHGADVYGLTCHSSRPFILASSSRDSTVRLWTLTSLIQPVEMNILAGKPWTEIFGTVESVMTPGSPPQLTGKESKDLRQRAEEYPTDVRSRVLKYFSKFFMVPTGTNNLWGLVSVVQGLDDTLLPQSYSDGIMHVKHLTKFYSSDAQELEMAKMTKHGGGIGAPTREERMREAASLHIKTGNIQRYCELMVEMGQWERALAVAPGVSLEYWKDLAKRYSDFLMKEDSDLAVPFCTAIGDSRRLAEFFMSRGQMSDAVLTAQVACEGAFTRSRPVSADSRQWNGTASPSEQNVSLLKETISELAESHFRNGSPVLAACCHLAVDDTKKAMARLIQGHELELAVAMGKVLGNLEEYTTVAMVMLSRRCEHLGKWELAVDLLLQVPNNELLLAKCCSRFSSNVVEMNQLHKRAGLPPLDGCQHEAEKLRTLVNKFECVKYYLLSNTPEVGLELGLKYVQDKMRNSEWVCDDVFEMLQLLGCIRTGTLQQHRQKTELLVLSAYVGALVGIRRGYNSIVPPLFSNARLLLQQAGSLDIGLTESQIQSECTTWIAAHSGQSESNNDVNTLSAEYRPVYTELLRKAGVEQLEVLKGAVCVYSSHLPSHSDVHVSCLTGERVQGLAYFLEDGHSAVSPNEALMWARVNPFSPSGSGYRINHF